jgi:NADPH2 dehydrogenase
MALLLKPLQAGALFLKNRLVMPPMATSKAEPDGKASRSLIDYYDEKSRGGHLSLIIIEHSFISPEGKASRIQLSVADDGAAESLKELAGIIRRNGSKAVAQINHAGSAAEREIIGATPVAPSAVANPRTCKDVPHELTGREIANIVAAFRDAAVRVKNAGFDGVEIHSAHGYLLNQFFSPLSNKRTDGYGGNVLNRIRIHLEVIDAIRRTLGRDFPLLLRLGASDYMEGGASIEDSVIAAQEFEKAGVDILDISGGFCGYAIPGVTGPQGYFSPLTAAIKERVSIPVILTGGITEAEAAEQLLAAGKADLIGVGRAILNDSDWARRAAKALEGAEPAGKSPAV